MLNPWILMMYLALLAGTMGTVAQRSQQANCFSANPYTTCEATAAVDIDQHASRRQTNIIRKTNQ